MQGRVLYNESSYYGWLYYHKWRNKILATNADIYYFNQCTNDGNNDPTSRDEVINAIIRSKYSETEEFAIQRHYANDSEKYSEEWKAYNEWCEYAKTTGTSWLS